MARRVGDLCTDGRDTWWRVVEVTPMGVVVLSDGWHFTTLGAVIGEVSKGEVTWDDGTTTGRGYLDGQG